MTYIMLTEEDAALCPRIQLIVLNSDCQVSPGLPERVHLDGVATEVLPSVHAKRNLRNKWYKIGEKLSTYIVKRIICLKFIKS